MAEVLNLHFDGANGSTTFVDSATGKTATAGGDAALTIAEKILGTASLRLPGSSDYATWADSADWEVGSNDWEIKGWFKLNALGAAQVIWGMRDAGNQQFYIRVSSGNQLVWHCEVAGAAWGTGATTITAAPVLTTGVWYYFKVKKVSTTVTVMISIDRVNFVSANSTGYTGSGPTGTFNTTIGCGHDAAGAVAPSSENFNGWIDEFVFDNGATSADVVPQVPNGGMLFAA